ncbi:hypothetical protein [Chitinophaga costaii]|nr:hypothetical protein [Chitinophaga costaii]
MKVETKEQYRAAMDRIYYLLTMLLEPGSPEEQELKELTDTVTVYEAKQEKEQE